MNMIFDSSEENIKKAVKSLELGGLVVIPTETVYGLAADACSDLAVSKIFEVKLRDKFNPLIVLFDSIGDIEKEVEFNKKARILASVFWPGALTLILPRKKSSNISLLCSGGLESLGVRLTSSSIGKDIINKLGKPITAPSANKSGDITPTKPQDVLVSLGDNSPMILAGGKSTLGLESTIIDMTEDIPVLCRAGAITQEEIEAHIGKINLKTNNKKTNNKMPLRLKAVDVKKGEALLAFGSVKFMGLEGGGFVKDIPEGSYFNLSEKGDLHEAASNLFSMLNSLNKGSFKSIAVMDIPKVGLGIAINERLKNLSIE